MDGLTAVISGEMAERGAMTFARFMELALYAPGLGYYERAGGNVGRGGDFYTSVSVGPLFGELLAFQFSGWLAELPQGAIPCLVEAGAHDGKLAADILGWLQQKRPDLFARIEYWIIEPSPQRQSWQRATLQKFSSQVRWLNQLTPNHHQFNGVIFSNELLDAFPVHRLGWDAAARAWFEWGVGWSDESTGAHPRTAQDFSLSPQDTSGERSGGRILPSETSRFAPLNQGQSFPGIKGGRGLEFPSPSAPNPRDRFMKRGHSQDQETSSPPPSPPSAGREGVRSPAPCADGRFIWHRLDHEIGHLAPQLPDELLAVLPDGFTTEVCPAAEQWWRQAAASLGSGKLLAIDYGLSDAEFFSPQRAHGTLRSYHRHHLGEDVLAQPGAQDLTAQVNFSRLQTAGESAGLRTDEFVSQTHFLVRLMEKFCPGEMPVEEFAATRARQFQTLTHPDHLGRSFRVLVQSRVV